MNRKYGALPPPGAAWQMGKTAEFITRINAIGLRLEEYHKHLNDPYTFYPDEVDAVRELKTHAAEDIEFLLGEIRK